MRKLKLDVKPYNKRKHLACAKLLLKKSDLSSLRHASLEMRYFLEAHVYERLLKDADQLPKSIIQRWEPNKAMKLLSMFDKLADMDLTLTISEHDGSSPITIQYNNIKNSELTKIYNTLGSYLHLPQPSKSDSYFINKEKLVKIFEKIKILIKGNLIIIKTDYDSFECESCQQPILFTRWYVEKNESIICQNDSCNVEHFIERYDGGCRFGSKIPCTCTCGVELEVFHSKLKVGEIIKCTSCLAKYRVDPNLTQIK